MPDHPLTHVDDQGNARMVDVSDKAITRREAVAEGFIALSADGYAAVVERTAKKGDVLAIAQLAGIQGAKRTADWIPLCHPLPLSSVRVECTPIDDLRIHVVARVRTDWRTGVEMEALAAVSAALLTVYDMLKALDKGMQIGPIRLVSKTGGRSGDWSRGG